MRHKIPFINRLNVRILAVLLVLFALTVVIVGKVYENNIRRLFQDTYTERVLLTNVLIASIIDSDDVNQLVELMKNQDPAFKQRQIRFFHDREELFGLYAEQANEEQQEILLGRLAAFHDEMKQYKTETYWRTLEDLRNLREVSHATYLYVMADTGLVADNGEKLYTYIIDAEDTDTTYDNPEIDGLGTCYTGEEALEEVYRTGKQMDYVDYYSGDYGELYFAYAPILDSEGKTIAVLGTDLDLKRMHSEIAQSIYLFNSILMLSIVFIILVIFWFIKRSVITPLSSLTNTAHELADGNVYTRVAETALKQSSEIGLLADAVSSMSLVYQNMIKGASSLFAAANAGKLEVRNDASQFKGDIQNVMKLINDTLDAMTLYLNSIPEGILIMSKDFEIHFRNEHFLKRFGDMPAAELLSYVFAGEDASETSPPLEQKILMERTAEALASHNNLTTVWIGGFCYSLYFKEILLGETSENSILMITSDITDLMKEKENAQAAAEAKSSFLSRMSHEMRTPMNAIIGMTKIAEDTDDVVRLKYCLSTIQTSSAQLLGIINDVLDMSKIEAGKLELENAPLNIEKMLMNICHILVDTMEDKNQKFNVIMSENLQLNYIGDELRLSQVLTNLLSNATKFTQDGGTITLSVEDVGRKGNANILHFAVTDNGIGMSKEQIIRLFNAFEQADGSISRKFGGTGLGLAISKNIVEKMDGRVWVFSEPDAGSAFHFEVSLERASHQEARHISGADPKNMKLLIIESNEDVATQFLHITESFGMAADAAASTEQAVNLLEKAEATKHPYTILFVACDMPDIPGLQLIRRLNGRIDPTTVILITTFLEWCQIEKEATENHITHYITKPLFPSSVLDAINDVTGRTVQTVETRTDTSDAIPDLSGVSLLLAEDIEINREIFLALLEDTRVSIDTAENGLIAVEKFRLKPDKYDLIIMDIQMPEMDGYQATQAIRAMDLPKAKVIPIIAMTANAFKEDIEHCLASGMNDHLAKPINETAVIEKIQYYTKQERNTTA